MNLKDLKQKVIRNLPEILGVTVAAAVVATAVIVVTKTLKDANIATTIRDTIMDNGGVIDLSNTQEVDALFDMIGEATEASISFISDNEAILFLSK